jgi:hypothetical protein
MTQPATSISKRILLPVLVAISTLNPITVEAAAITKWDCRIDGWSGTWDVEGQEIVGPLQDIVDVRPHFLILKNTQDLLVAAQTPYRDGADVMTVILNKKALTIKLSHLVAASDIVDTEKGACRS